MTNIVNGCNITLKLTANELTSNDYVYILPRGYTINTIYITVYITDLTKAAEIRFTIEKFGQIPDAQYFDKAFKPILVTGDDGKEYNVIPSDQFK